MQARYYDRDSRPVWGWPDITAARAGHQAVTAWIDQVAA